MEHVWEIANDKEHEWWSQDGSNFLRCTIQNIIWNTKKKSHGLIKPHPSMGLNETSSSHNVFVMVYFLLFCVTLVWIILNRLVHCFARMSSPSHFVVSPHQKFCESFTCMNNLLKWYEKEFLKCINK